ncbi:hypothetical protein [Pseudomonas sp. Irchel s3h14]|uniref:hypothetical protein n=1 Tax=Pseudomonas sp. Irchel s3h14 TaxID=2009179 RepID=UPI000BA3ABA1|nr:hypothetical protein [Pseudomonas sp. Irchel s3h14]
MSKNAGAHAFLLAASMASAVYAHADNAETANKSNNPLNLAPGANLQDYYTPKLYDTNAHTNDILMRGTLPIAPNDFIGVPQLLRATVPISLVYIPIGFGGGKVWKSGTNILNVFVEPQWTVERKGDGLPQFTLYAGINVTFGK